jgi:hypothetical protein
VVAYPRSDRVFSLIVDAATGTPEAKGGLGAILCQTDAKGEPRVISYSSRALTDSEKKLHTIPARNASSMLGNGPF